MWIRYVGAGAAHVEADHGLLGGRAVGGEGVADDAASGPAQNGAAAREVRDGGEAAVGLHEEQGLDWTGELGLECVQVLLDAGRQVGVDTG